MLVTVLIVVALVLAIVAELRAQGQDLTAWAVIVLASALIIERYG